jgi:CopG-like RHH_1 or ribbon-helix-helix domain, RHH_5
VSKRINITLPDSVVEELECWAEAQGRSLANLAAFLLESAVKQAKEKGEIPDREFPVQQKKPRSEK